MAATFAKRKAEAERHLERNDSSVSQRQLKPQLLEQAREAAQLAACLSQVSHFTAAISFLEQAYTLCRSEYVQDIPCWLHCLPGPCCLQSQGHKVAGRACERQLDLQEDTVVACMAWQMLTSSSFEVAQKA